MPKAILILHWRDHGPDSQQRWAGDWVGFQSIPVQSMLATHSDWHPDNVSDPRDIPPSTLVFSMDNQLQADVPTEPIAFIFVIICWFARHSHIHCLIWISKTSSIVKPLMFALMLACPLFREFREPNKSAKRKGANINRRPKAGRNYYSISNYMVSIRQNNFACKVSNF